MGQNKITLLLVVLLLALGGYYYFSLSSSQEQSPAVGIDSVSVTERPSIEAPNDTTPIPVAEDIAPGMALVRVKIDSVFYQEQTPAVIKTEVLEVLGYGPSTSPIAPGSSMELKVDKYIEANPNIAKEVKEGETVRLLLSEQMQMQGMNQSGHSSQWRINKLIQ